MANSPGDPRVLLVMNVALSTAFAAVVVYGASLVGLGPFTLQRVGMLALVLTLLTHLVVVR